jgi:hypothetical protein
LGIVLLCEIDLGRDGLLSSSNLLATTTTAAAGPSQPGIFSLLRDRGVLWWDCELGCFCYLLKVVPLPLALFVSFHNPSI